MSTRLPLVLVATAVSLAVGCSRGSSEANSPATTATPPAASTTDSSTAGTDTTAPGGGTECADAAAALAAGDSLSPEVLNAFASAASEACSSLDELRAALDAQDLVRLDEIVINSCVAGDAWARHGEPSVLADMQLCQEARSRFTLGPGRELVPAQSVQSEDFSDGCGVWPNPESPGVQFLCEGANYAFVVERARIPWHSVIEIEPPSAALSVEADAALVAPETAGEAYYGVSCWASDDLGYSFTISPAGGFVITRLDVTGASTRFLALGETPRAVPGVGKWNRIRGECTANPDATRLALYVNGYRVAAARDRSNARLFRKVGFYVLASEPGTDVRFDNVLVRIPSGS